MTCWNYFYWQEISLTLSFEHSSVDSKPTSSTVATALEQIDGFGCGPKRRKLGEDAYEEDGADAADDDDDDGARRNSEFWFMNSRVMLACGRRWRKRGRGFKL
jgi:hypothetical protein